MKSTLPKSSIVILVIALVLSMWLSTHLARARNGLVIHAPNRAARAGFGKFLSHVGWMRLLQYRGSIEKVTKEDADRLARRYDKLTDLDPLFIKAYEEGALDIQFHAPEEALKLLDKAMAVDKIDDWKIAYTAGFIAKNRLKDSERAIRYFEQAAKQPNHPSYVDRSLIYLKAERADNDPLVLLTLWVDYYAGGPGYLFREETPPDKFGEERFVASGTGIGGVYGGGPADPERAHAVGKITRLSAEIVEDAKKCLVTEKNETEKKVLQQKIDDAERIMRKIHAGSHVCPRCFQPYNAGDRFCAHDGTAVKVFGVCPKDGETIVKGAFCQKCGAKVK